MRSFAQKPTLSTQPKVTYKNAIPARNKHVAQAPMMSGTHSTFHDTGAKDAGE